MEKKFKEFRIGDILCVEHTLSVVSKSDLIEGDIPYVTRTANNNGYMSTCGNINKINSGNCITIGAETGIAFYQPKDFVAGNKVYKLSRDGLNENMYLYLVAALNKHTKNYSYSNARIPEKIKEETINLPLVDGTDDQIDFEYMSKYISELEAERISELEAERISELEAFLVATGLNDYELTEDDRQILTSALMGGQAESQNLTSSDSCSKWERKYKEFRVGDICTQLRGKEASPNKVPDGNVNMVNEMSTNNGIAKKGMSDYIFKAPAITVSVNFAQTVFFQEEDFCASVNILILKADWMLKYPKAALYLVSILRKNNQQYDYTNKISKDKLNNTIVSLPLVDGFSDQIDFSYMERYVKAIEKNVIADVVKYKDQVIEETKKVVANNTTK